MADKVLNPALKTDTGALEAERARDESDGTYSQVRRSRLEVWDATNSTWIKARANTKGALVVDRGGAGADSAISATYTSAQSATVLLAVASTSIVHFTGALVALSNAASVTAGAYVSIASNIVARHPGMPAGGGYAISDVDVAYAAGDDLVVDCDVPTGGSISVTVYYWLEAV